MRHSLRLALAAVIAGLLAHAPTTFAGDGAGSGAAPVEIVGKPMHHYRTSAVADAFLLSVSALASAKTPGRAIMTDEEKSNYELLLELSAGFNAHDLDRIMLHFAEDCSLDMRRGNKPWGGYSLHRKGRRAQRVGDEIRNYP